MPFSFTCRLTLWNCSICWSRNFCFIDVCNKVWAVWKYLKKTCKLYYGLISALGITYKLLLLLQLWNVPKELIKEEMLSLLLENADENKYRIINQTKQFKSLKNTNFFWNEKTKKIFGMVQSCRPHQTQQFLTKFPILKNYHLVGIAFSVLYAAVMFINFAVSAWPVIGQ